MNKKSTAKIGIVLGLTAIIGLGAIGAYAFSDEYREKAGQAIENNDYGAWKGAMQEKVEGMQENAKGMQEKATQENFDKLSEARKLKREGKYEEAQKIMEEAGFGKKGAKDCFRNRNFNPEEKEQMIQALESKDYNAWKELNQDCPVIDEGNFNKYVEMHEARKEGDYEEMRQLKEEFGSKSNGFHGHKKF